MKTVKKLMRSVIVATTNACLLCGADDAIDWVNYVSKRFIDRIPFTGKRKLEQT